MRGLRVAAVVLALGSLTVRAGAETLPKADLDYLRQLARDTWACMDHFRAAQTGFPYDSNFRPDQTNTTNIGLYLMGVVAAQELGFITPAQARQRVTQILGNLKKVQHWQGFFNNHLDVNGGTKARAGVNAASDFNKLPASFLVLRQAYPDIRESDELFRRIDWSVLYDPNRRRMALGYDITTGALSFWGNGWFMSDQRTAIFLAVATGGLPEEFFYRLDRNQVEQYGLEFYRPAWDYAGLFMQAMEGLLSDERTTSMGRSAANFAYAQMLFARQRNYPAWGWSACDIPNVGYTIDGHLSQSAVTPHASALMISYYPRKVVANLRALEALGVREPFRENGKSYAFGFRDSVNVTTGEISNLYFTGLDQAMLFLALANYLEDGCIWRLFEQDPVVRQGVEKLREYRERDPSLLRVYAERDAAEFAPAPAAAAGRPPILLDHMGNGDLNQSGQARSLRIENAPPEAFRLTKAKGWMRPHTLRLEYDLSRYPDARVALVEPLNLDAEGYNAVAFSCRGENPQGLPMGFRLRLTDGLESKPEGLVEGIGPEWQEVMFPFEMLRGILADPSRLGDLEFRFDRAPEFMSGARLSVTQGSIELDNLRLVSLTRAQLKQYLLAQKRSRELSVAPNGEVEGLAEPSGWQNFADDTSRLALQIDTEKKLMRAEYGLGAKGKWVAWEKTWKEDLSKDFQLSLEYKAAGSDNTLEIKFFSASGGVFGRKIAFKGSSAWQKVTLRKKDLVRLWGGRPEDQLGRVERFGFAVSDQSGTAGVLEIRNLSMSR